MHESFSDASYGLVELFTIGMADFLNRSIHALLALFNPDGALADSLDLLHGVGDEQNGDLSRVDETLDTCLAFFLKEYVAYRKCLVDDEDVGLRDRSDGESDAGDHTG